jgi:hypothetical protein
MALAGAGRFEEAATILRNAIAAAGTARQPELVARLTPMLRRFERRQPCTSPLTCVEPR